jgi:hypothetical protein
MTTVNTQSKEIEPKTPEDFLRQLVEMANQNMELMDGTTEPIKRLFEAGEIVIGVWQDLSRPYGIDFLVLKGAKLLM